MTSNDNSVITVKPNSRVWPYLYGIANPDEEVRMTLLDRDEEPLANFPLLALGYCWFVALEHTSLTFDQTLILEARDKGQVGSVVIRLEDGVHVGPLGEKYEDVDVVVDIEDFREFTKRLGESISVGRLRR